MGATDEWQGGRPYRGYQTEVATAPDDDGDGGRLYRWRVRDDEGEVVAEGRSYRWALSRIVSRHVDALIDGPATPPVARPIVRERPRGRCIRCGAPATMMASRGLACPNCYDDLAD